MIRYEGQRISKLIKPKIFSVLSNSRSGGIVRITSVTHGSVSRVGEIYTKSIQVRRTPQILKMKHA